MKKNIVKISIIFLIAILTFTTFTSISSYAATVTGTFNGTTSSDGTLKAVRQILGIVLNAVRTIGLAVAIIILTYIGIKFMMAAPSERANIKQYSMNYVIGAVIMVGAVGIITIVQKFAEAIKVT